MPAEFRVRTAYCVGLVFISPVFDGMADKLTSTNRTSRGRSSLSMRRPPRTGCSGIHDRAADLDHDEIGLGLTLGRLEPADDLLGTCGTTSTVRPPYSRFRSFSMTVR